MAGILRRVCSQLMVWEMSKVDRMIDSMWQYTPDACHNLDDQGESVACQPIERIILNPASKMKLDVDLLPRHNSPLFFKP